MPDWIALALGLALPWTFGACLLTLAYRHRASAGAAPPAWIFGCGWFVGIFVLTLLMRAVSAAGLHLSILTVGGPLALVGIVLAWFAWRQHAGHFREHVLDYARALGGQGLEGWQKFAWLALIGWLLLRFALLFAEVWWLPLFPWDAWTQWGTKARVWFELKTLVPFVPGGEWLSSALPIGYYDAAPHYPSTVPLFQVWSALLIGRWDDALVNLPWWVRGVAFAIALHGALTDLGFSRLMALVGSAMVMSLPILNAHIALAGYAELPMAAYLTLGTLAALRFLRTRGAADGGLALLLLAACVMIKIPGKAWIVVLLPGLAVAASPRWGRKLAGAAFVLAAAGILVLTQTGGINILNYRVSAEFGLPWRALLDAYFSYGNWHLLWYCVVAAVVLGRRQLMAPGVAPLTCIVAAALLFLFIGFAFTNAGAWVEDQSTVNRATLHIAPVVVVWVLVVLRAWYRAGSSMASDSVPGTRPA